MTDHTDLIRRLLETARELEDSGGDYDVTVAALLREAAKALAKSDRTVRQGNIDG